MPIYEYKCQKCGERFEFKMPIDAPDGVDCTKCGGVALRLISSFSFTLAQPNIGARSKVNPNARQVRR